MVPGTSHKTNPTAFEMSQRNTIYTNVALRPDGTPWWEGHDDPPPAEALDWQGRTVDTGVQREGRTSQQPVHDAGGRMRVALTGIRQPEWRADRRDPVRCPPAAACAAGLRVGQLATRHVSRGDVVVGDNRGGDRQGRCPASRSDGDVAVLRLQHGRLLRALARNRRVARETAANLPRELVSNRRSAGVSCGPASARTCACCKWVLDRAEGRGKARQTAIGGGADT